MRWAEGQLILYVAVFGPVVQSSWAASLRHADPRRNKGIVGSLQVDVLPSKMVCASYLLPDALDSHHALSHYVHLDPVCWLAAYYN
jgi:hypothetical protein